MADSSEVKYRYQSAKVIRGREASTIKKMQDDGWELDSRGQGPLRTELQFRRAKTPTPWRLVATLMVAALMVIAVVGGIVALRSEDDATGAAAPSPRPGASTTATETSSPSATQTQPPRSVNNEVLTVNSNSDLRRLLTMGEDSNLSQRFSKTYEGRTIAFNGNVAVATPHGAFKTRFDFLVYAGDYSETVANPGPSFQFRDVNFQDLKLQGRGLRVGTGDNLRIIAEVGAFEPRSGLFLLEPISTQFR